MQQFIETCSVVRKMIGNDSVLLDKEYQSFELAEGYRVEQWRNDKSVDIELQRKFRTILNRSRVYNLIEIMEELGSGFSTEFRHQNCNAKGCLLAYEMEGVVVSFVSDEHWCIPWIDGTYAELDGEGELLEKEAQVPNVSCEENIEQFSAFYAERQELQRVELLHSGQEILAFREEAFPNLIFCENALRQLECNIGVTEAPQVYKRLKELQNAAKNLEGPFCKDMLAHATPESQETLRHYEQEHSIKLPDGSSEIFSWHTRFTGSYGGRIFFVPRNGCREIIIGHIGPKLPTVKYH